MIHLLSSYILWQVDTGGTENSISEISEEWWTRRLWTFGMFEPSLVLIILGINHSNCMVLIGSFIDSLLFVTLDTRWTENSQSEFSLEWWMERLWTFGMFKPSLVLIITGMNYSNYTMLSVPSIGILLFVMGGRKLNCSYDLALQNSWEVWKVLK